MAAADQSITIGAVLTVDSNQTLIRCMAHRGVDRGLSIMNKGPNTVYISWDPSVSVVLNKNKGDKKGYIDSGDAIRIPKNARAFLMQCNPAETATLIAVED